MLVCSCKYCTLMYECVCVQTLDWVTLWRQILSLWSCWTLSVAVLLTRLLNCWLTRSTALKWMCGLCEYTKCIYMYVVYINFWKGFLLKMGVMLFNAGYWRSLCVFLCVCVGVWVCLPCWLALCHLRWSPSISSSFIRKWWMEKSVQYHRTSAMVKYAHTFHWFFHWISKDFYLFLFFI